MNVDLQRILTERADSVEAPAFVPQDVLAQGERMTRRRRRLASAGVAAVLAVALGTAALVADRTDGPPPANRPVPAPEWTPGTRPLTYGQGQTLHLGERTIRTGLDFLSIDPTDDGAALTTVDGGIWFSDGTSVDRIGATLGVRRATDRSIDFFVGRPREWVASADAGSLLAWMEFPGHRIDEPELVVYDTSKRTVVGRQPIEVRDGNSALVLDVVDDAVFVAEDSRGSFEPPSVFRYDVGSRTLDRVQDGDVEAARREVARVLVVGSTDYGEILHAPDRTTADARSVGAVDVRGSELYGLRDPHSGEPVELRVPERYDRNPLWFTQWVDDDRFALVTDAGADDLLVCSISAGRCDAVVSGFTEKNPATTPGDGLRGAELALGRALRSR